MLCLAVSASAQTPASQLGRPSQPQWGQFTNTPALPQYPQTPIASTVPQAAPIGTRVITNPNQNPTITPTQGVDLTRINTQTPMPTKPESTSTIKSEDVFKFSSDKELDTRIIDVANSYYKERYDQDLKKFEMTKRPEDKPTLKVVTLGDLPTAKTTTSQSGTTNSRLDATPMTMQTAAGFIVHRRLYFEEMNSERYGWNLGLAQPLISTAYFYRDVVLLPSKFCSSLFERHDTNAGKCLPGSPVPYKLYPPDITLFGWAGGAASIAAIAFFFP